jgi:hypothetical protein
MLPQHYVRFIVYGLFNDAVSSSEYVELNGRMINNELEIMLKGALVSYFYVLSQTSPGWKLMTRTDGLLAEIRKGHL